MRIRYIAIEHNSGLIWGDAIAETPELACAAIDLEADPSKASIDWERVSPIRDTDGGYQLYIAPADFPDDYDSRDQEAIDRLTATGLHVGDYRPVRLED